MHGDEAYLKEEWKWETLQNKGLVISHHNSINQILSLQGTLGEEVKIGCRVSNGFTHGKPTEIRIYYSNFSKPRDNEKSWYNIPKPDYWYNLTFTQPVLALCLWGKCGVELLFNFMITERRMWNLFSMRWPWNNAYILCDVPIPNLNLSTIVLHNNITFHRQD